MNKETVILRIKASIDFSKESLLWLKHLANESKQSFDDDELWFTQQGGIFFLREYGGIWNEILIEESDSLIQNYFLQLGFRENVLPKTKVIESYAGSWIIEAAVIVATTVGGAYALIKAVSEIPEMSRGLTELKNSIAKRFEKRVNDNARQILEQQANKSHLPSPPPNVLELKDFVLDARPLEALKPSEMQSHTMHLSVGVSHESFTLENLGDKTLRDVRIGLFVGENKRNQWSFTESYSGSVLLLSPKQTISKQLGDFCKDGGDKLSIVKLPVHIDCWVQDSYGIYLFNFYLQE